jgi:hypothetical protein
VGDGLVTGGFVTGGAVTGGLVIGGGVNGGTVTGGVVGGVVGGAFGGVLGPDLGGVVGGALGGVVGPALGGVVGPALGGAEGGVVGPALGVGELVGFAVGRPLRLGVGDECVGPAAGGVLALVVPPVLQPLRTRPATATIAMSPTVARLTTEKDTKNLRIAYVYRYTPPERGSGSCPQVRRWHPASSPRRRRGALADC